MDILLQKKKEQMGKILRPPFYGGPVPKASMAPIDEKALSIYIMEFRVTFWGGWG